MPVSTITPTTPTRFDTSYGGIPAVPSPTATGAAAIGGNLANLADLYKLGGGINTFNIAQARAPLIAGLPNYEQMLTQSSGNISDLLAGRIPADVRAQMARTAAERGVQTGDIYGPNVDAALLAATGRTSLELTGLGEQQLTGAIARTPQAKLFDPASMLITPEQQQEAEMAANIYAAAPTPADAASAAMAAARAGAGRMTGFPSYGGGGRVSGVSPLVQKPLTTTPEGGVYAAGPGVGTRTGSTYADRIAAAFGDTTVGPGASYWDRMTSPVGAGTFFAGAPGDQVHPQSSTAQALWDMGIDPTGWSRQDAASILGVSPQELDLGAPAGGGQTLASPGTSEDWWAQQAMDLGLY